MPPEMKDAGRALHEQAIVIDGLIIAKFGRPVFEAMLAGGITAANCTCSVWEGFTDSMRNIAQWMSWFAEHDDILMPVRQAEDILEAKRQGKVGIILGWQNISGIEDRLEYLSLFKKLGVNVMQLTYQTQNLAGCGCFETQDHGLSDFGREIIDEMNRLGIVCDLSHVGNKTSEEAIKYSKRPMAYTHCLPSALKPHPRNKSDEELRFIVDHGGFVGVTMFPHFLKKGSDASVGDYVEAIEHVVNVVGEDNVGIGTDFTQGHDRTFFEWLSHDKGRYRQVAHVGEVINPAGLETLDQFSNITIQMAERGWNEDRVRKIIGQNWFDFFKEGWRPSSP